MSRYILVDGTNLIVGTSSTPTRESGKVAYDLDSAAVTGDSLPENIRDMEGGTFTPERVYTAPA